MEVYKASLDKSARQMIWAVFIIYATVWTLGIRAVVLTQYDHTTIVVNVILLATFSLIIFRTYIYATKHYVLDDSELTIVKRGTKRKIKLDSIFEVVVLSEEDMKNAMRNFGVGGFFGFNGNYHIAEIGKITLHGTQRKNGILITTRLGEKIVITPDDTSMVEKIDPLKKEI